MMAYLLWVCGDFVLCKLDFLCLGVFMWFPWSVLVVVACSIVLGFGYVLLCCLLVGLVVFCGFPGGLLYGVCCGTGFA